jgi:hypothetical protein
MRPILGLGLFICFVVPFSIRAQEQKHRIHGAITLNGSPAGNGQAGVYLLSASQWGSFKGCLNRADNGSNCINESGFAFVTSTGGDGTYRFENLNECTYNGLVAINNYNGHHTEELPAPLGAIDLTVDLNIR